MLKTIPLGGRWKFRVDPEGMGDLYPDSVVRSYHRDCKFFDVDYDDSDWDQIIVPSCWQAQGYNYNGIAWYRLKFDYQSSPKFNVVRLEFKGVDYFADVWLNGYYLGSHEGFFNKFFFDISPWIKEKSNILVVRVDSPKDTNVKIINGRRKNEKKLIKGALQDWDVNNLEVNPGGIWNDVNLLLSRDLYIESLKVDSLINFKKKEADVISKIKIFNSTKTIKKVTIKVTLSPYNFQGEEITSSNEEILTPGISYKEVFLKVPNVRLWWTWDFGKPNLYTIKIDVLNKTNELLDSLEDRIGIREIKTKEGSWETYLNERRVFFRGTNYLSDQLLSNMNLEKYKKDVDLIKEANMNMVRLFAIVEKEEFYKLCDEKGILIYQDFPVQWRMSNSGDLVRRAVSQARDMINQLYNHPSIGIWCYGSENSPENFEKLGMALVNESKKCDPYRPVQQGNAPLDWFTQDLPFEYYHKKYHWPIDYHCYSGWYPSKGKKLESSSVYDIKEIDNRLFEFVSEYGSQSLPSLTSLGKFIPAKDLWPPNWKLYNRHCLQDKIMERWIGKPDNLEEWIEKSQIYQAFQLKYHTEYYRLHKFHPCNGALQFCFKDCWPAITWSIVDYYGERKLAYFVLKQAFNPVHVIMDPPYDSKVGKRFSKKIYLINDYPRIFESLRVEYVVESKREKIITNSINCKIDENTVKEIGTIDFQHKEGYTDKEISIKLKLFEGDKLISENEYKFTPRNC